MNLIALTFLTNMTGNITNHFTSPDVPRPLASARLQTIPALKAAKKIGLNTSVWSLHSSQSKDYFEMPEGNICFVGKMSADTEPKAQEMILANAAAIFNHKSKGSKIVTLYCDNLIAREGIISDFYRNILLASDHVIFPTESLRKASSSYISAKTQSHIIEDPWQIMHEYGRKFIPEGESCKILWFGSNANIQYLLNVLEELIENLEQSRMFELSILGGTYAINQTRIILSMMPKRYPNWAVRLVKWDSKNQPMQLEKELKRSHISLIPSDPLDPLKIGVSHNRLVDSLRGGCLTIASPMESYKELHSCCLLGNDFPRLINQSISDYDNISGRLLKHRAQNLKRFNPAENARKWTQAWRKILQN